MDVPITVKIRIFEEEERTFKMVERLREAGAALITIHGRTRKQKGDKICPPNWDIIKRICEAHPGYPIICNGGIRTFSDVERCLRETGCAAVMSAEGILENPAVFCPKMIDIDQVTLEYLEICRKYDTPSKFIKGHLFKLLHPALRVHTDQRDKLGRGRNIEDFEEICKEIGRRRKDAPLESKFGWYVRHEEKKGEGSPEKKEDENGSDGELKKRGSPSEEVQKKDEEEEDGKKKVKMVHSIDK